MTEAKRAVQPKLDIDDFYIPEDLEDLNEQVKSARVPNIKNLAQHYFASGSGVTQIQFLSLRVTFPPRIKIRDFAVAAERKKYGLESWAWNDAMQLVNNCPELKKYFRILELDIPIDTVGKTSPLWPGSLKPVRKIQEQVVTIQGIHDRDRGAGSTVRDVDALILEATNRLDNPEKGAPSKGELKEASAKERSKAAKNPEAEDEVSSNTAIVLLLQAILDLVPNSQLEWQLTHLHLQGVFGNGSYSAFTDGGLLSTVDQGIFAIVEAKKRQRTEKTESIQMQEGAEMVGLIRSEKGRRPLRSHRIVVSQDRDEVYITFASWHPEYLAYLEGGPVTKKSHIEMQTVGPWLTGRAPHMKQLAVAVAAIILIAKNIDAEVDA